jgi:hypothetical protein
MLFTVLQVGEVRVLKPLVLLVLLQQFKSIDISLPDLLCLQPIILFRIRTEKVLNVQLLR